MAFSPAQNETNNSYVVGRTSQDTELRGQLLKLTRYSVVFEMYNPTAVLRTSEALQEFKIFMADRALYAGTAVVRSLINSGPAVVVCEATLNEAAWVEVGLAMTNGKLSHKLDEEYQAFMREWQKLYRVRPEYKLVLADMQTYFTDLRLWLDRLELSARAASPGDQVQMEKRMAEELATDIVPSIDGFFDKFETVAETLDEGEKPVHMNYMKRQLHSLMLCSPFAHRTFYKPLGYAGDYEMVNMILRNAPEGGSLFAKVLNTWFVHQPPAVAHRNRITYLTKKLVEETLRTMNLGRKAQVFNLACGPAQEVQRFLAEHQVSENTEFTLLDFNEQTLQYIRPIMDGIKRDQHRLTKINYVKKSVHHILKETGRTVDRADEGKYDFVYCAGLFDYLSDQVCRRLTNAMYEWLAPGGLLVVTNVEPSNPLRNGMEHLLDWHLIYRTGPQLLTLKPDAAAADDAVVRMDDTGVNVFLEVRKPDHV